MATGFAPADKPRGKYQFSRSMGDKRFYGTIKLKPAAFKKETWANDYLQPTMVQLKGKIELEGDSLTLKPESVSFFRKVAKGGEAKYDRVSCDCTPLGLSALDPEAEKEIARQCDPHRYYWTEDALIEHGTENRFVKD